MERASAALEQAEDKRAGNPGLPTFRARADALREMGIREREKASGRRLLLRVGAAVLALAAAAGFFVSAALRAKQLEAEEAKERAVWDAMLRRDSK